MVCGKQSAKVIGDNQMLELNAKTMLEGTDEWEKAGVKVPEFSWQEMIENTEKYPVWLHFGSGNIFRGFIAKLQQELLNKGLQKSGIITVSPYDREIIDKVYTPHDNLSLNVTLNPDGTISKEIVASIGKSIKVDSELKIQELAEIITKPSLQMLSFTITEKGYALTDMKGELLPMVSADMEQGPKAPKNTMCLVTGLLYRRYKAGQYPLTLVSMDNCSHNGEKLQKSIMTVAKAWLGKGFVDKGFLDYLDNPEKIAFPWSMIDKITPRPNKKIAELLTQSGIGGMDLVVTKKATFIAPFVNAERPQYLVIEDYFTNGRPPLEEAGVYMTDRETVNKTEKMKVTTCLNPLHTAMSVFGCLLGYTLICKEMQDADIVALIKRLGYKEGLPVVVDPKILSPKAFIDEVVEKRLPNPFMPDAPQRIATDTSQKVGVRFGETIKSYLAAGKDLSTLVSLPLAIAGWMRYLLAVDDAGNPMEVSSDPLKADLQSKLSGIEFDKPESYKGQLKEILSNKVVFGVDLVQAGLAGKIETMFKEMLAGPGAVRKVLHKYVG
jgi:fructuronate reductase